MPGQRDAAGRDLTAGTTEKGARGRQMATDPKNSVEGAQAAATSEVISAFGGLRPMAKKLGVAVSTLQGWQSRGQIPPGRSEEIAVAAEREKVELSLGVLEAATGRETGGEATVRSTPADSPETPSGEVEEEPAADPPLTAGAPEAKASALRSVARASARRKPRAPPLWNARRRRDDPDFDDPCLSGSSQ